MKTLNVLLCNSDRRVANLIEALVRDVCYNQAVVNCTRSAQVEDFIIQARERECDLIIVAPDDLLLAGGRRVPRGSISEAVRAVREIRERRGMPIIAVGISAEFEVALLEAGVDRVMEIPFNCDKLKSAVRQVLNLPEWVEPPAVPERWSLTGALMRTLQRLTHA
jgi:DNA-binding response OmpR family regulator